MNDHPENQGQGDEPREVFQPNALERHAAAFAQAHRRKILSKLNECVFDGEIYAEIAAELDGSYGGVDIQQHDTSKVEVLDISPEEDDLDDWEYELDKQMPLHPVQTMWFKTLVVMLVSSAVYGLTMLWYNQAKPSARPPCDGECVRVLQQQAEIREGLKESQ